MDTTTITAPGVNAAEATISALGIAREQGFDPFRVLSVNWIECRTESDEDPSCISHPGGVFTGEGIECTEAAYAVEIAGWEIPENERRAMAGDR
jgi:hypothetical protein